MNTQDPNKFASQDAYSWSEPVIGSRQEWKNDHWRFLKMGAVVAVIFSICAWNDVSITLPFVTYMGAVYIFTYAFFWIFTFVPRRIVLFVDRLAIFRGASRQSMAAITIYYSNIKQIKITQENKNYMMLLTLTSGKPVYLYSPNKLGVDSLEALLKEFPIAH